MSSAAEDLARDSRVGPGCSSRVLPSESNSSDPGRVASEPNESRASAGTVALRPYHCRLCSPSMTVTGKSGCSGGVPSKTDSSGLDHATQEFGESHTSSGTVKE
jgi:hypothetical protein